MLETQITSNTCIAMAGDSALALVMRGVAQMHKTVFMMTRTAAKPRGSRLKHEPLKSTIQVR